MRVIVDIRRAAAGERGGVLVMVAIWMPLLIVVMTFAIDMSNWFQHKRHLQMQADAGALAAMQEVLFDCDATTAAAAVDAVARYSGVQFNAQIGGTPADRIFRRVNSKTFHNQTATPKPQTPDDTVEASPCDSSMIDVKLTETDLPWFFPPFRALWDGIGGGEDVSFINARARISFLRQDTASGSLPVAVPEVNPKAARAWFVNESTGAVLGSTPLKSVGPANGLAVWDNADAPLPVKFDSGDEHVGVVIALGGGSSTTCGQPLVECFDAATSTGGMPSSGIVYMRGWSATGSGAQPGSPIVRQARLLPGTCADPYFSAATTTCRFGVRATVDFGPVADPVASVGASVSADVGGTKYPLAYDPASGTWSVDAAIPLAPGAGPVNVSLEWAETKGTWNGNTCSTGNGNKCKGSLGVVQRAFAATNARSGPVQVAQVWRDGVQWANTVERCSAVQTSCTHNMVVRIAIKGSLKNAQDQSDPAVELRVTGGSQNQSLDCDKDKSMVEELATGCAPSYARNTGTACPASPTTLWASPQPWPCVAVQTGSAVNQVPRGLNLRILGNEKPASCTSPNRWSSFPDLDPGDPRLIQVLLTPYGAFGGSGTTTVPVTDFATFYVTGWTGSGGGFTNPCQGNGDDPVADSGYIVGHFVKYIQSLNPPGTGTTPCDLSAFGSCFAELTH